jgi:hypothetical protein
MTRAGIGKAAAAYIAAVSGLLGGSLSFPLCNRHLIAWYIEQYYTLPHMYPSVRPTLADVARFWLGPEIVLNVLARALLGAAAGASASAILGRSFRVAFWLGLAAGFLLTLLAVPEVQLIRD